MKKLIYISLFLVMTVFGGLGVVKAQEKQKITDKDYANQSVEMADEMRSNGKIYIVVATLSVILGGVLFYVIKIDNKVTKLEKSLED